MDRLKYPPIYNYQLNVMLQNTYPETESTYLSIIVCTRNRAKELRTCLPALIQEAKTFDDVEIVMVDNGSNDDTAAVVSKLAEKERCPVVYVYEPVAGLCVARNRGMKTAKGKVLVYIDDDAVPHKGWVGVIREIFQDQHVDSAGGRIIAKPQGGMPDWFPPGLVWVIGEYYKGDEQRRYNLPHDCPAGGNFAVRKQVSEALGGFDERLKLYNDEVDFFRRMSENGFNSVYFPKMVVDHCPYITRDNLLTKAFRMGQAQSVAAMLAETSLYGQLKRVLKHIFHSVYLGTSWLVTRRFDHAFNFWLNQGGIWGFLKRGI